MQSANAAPYISLVVTSRNDNHGKNMLGRMQAFLDSWILQSQQFQLRSEIIVVEWNPPPDRPPLRRALKWPAATDTCDVRFIEVSPAIHQAIGHGSSMPLHQMIAKNAGVLRAKGEFILCTNIDIVFSAELMQFLASRPLDPAAMYRMDRYDIQSDLPDGTLGDLLDYSQRHIVRVCAREGVWSTSGERIRRVEAEDIIEPGPGLRLGGGWFGVEAPQGVAFRCMEAEADLYFERPPSAANQIMFDAEVGPSARDGWVDFDILDADGNELASTTLDGRCKLRLRIPEEIASGRIRLRVRNGGLALLEDPRLIDLRVFAINWNPRPASPNAEPRPSGWKLDVTRRTPGTVWTPQSPHAPYMRNAVYLHTNACGDFTMMSRKAWHSLRGYPEFPVWPTHLDALTCYAAHHAGIREVILEDPLRIFHIEHDAVWTPETEEERKARAAKIGVPMFDYSTFVQHLHYMRRFDVPLVYSGAKWGLSGLDLPESIVTT